MSNTSRVYYAFEVAKMCEKALRNIEKRRVYLREHQINKMIEQQENYRRERVESFWGKLFRRKFEPVSREEAIEFIISGFHWGYSTDNEIKTRFLSTQESTIKRVLVQANESSIAEADDKITVSADDWYWVDHFFNATEQRLQKGFE